MEKWLSWIGARRERRAGSEGRRGDLLILLPVVGISGGKRKSTVVTRTYAIPSYRLD